jgi:hypothetical protein
MERFVIGRLRAEAGNLLFLQRVNFRGVEEATRREQEKNGGRRGPRLRVLKCSEASGRDDTERKKKWQIQIK